MLEVIIRMPTSIKLTTIYFIQLIFISSSVIIGVYSYWRNAISEKLVIVLYSLVSCAITIPVLFADTGMIYVNIFTIFEYFVFAILIYKEIGSKKNKGIVFTLTVLFLLVATSYIRYPQWRYRIQSQTIVIENISLTILCLLYYKSLLTLPEIFDITKNFIFWVVTGAICYFCLTTPYYLLIGILSYSHFPVFYSINAITNIAMHCLFIKGFLCTLKKL